MNFPKIFSMFLVLCVMTGYASADPTYMPGKYSDTPVKTDPKVKVSAFLQMPGLEAGVLAARKVNNIDMSVVLAEMGDEIAKMKNVNEFPPKYTAALMKRWAKTAPADWSQNHLAVVLIALPPDHRSTAMAADPGSQLVAWGVDGAFLSKAIDKAYKKYLEVPAAKQNPQAALLMVLEQVNTQVTSAKQKAQAQAALLAQQRAAAEKEAKLQQARAEAQRQAELLRQQKRAEEEARRAEAERLAIVEKQRREAERAQREAAARPPVVPVAPARVDTRPQPAAPARTVAPSTAASTGSSSGGGWIFWLLGFLGVGFGVIGLALKSMAEGAAAALKQRVTGLAEILQKLSSMDANEGYGELVGENFDAPNKYPQGSQEYSDFANIMGGAGYLFDCFKLLQERETFAASSVRGLSWYNPMRSYNSYCLSTSDAIELPAPKVHVSQIKDMWNLGSGRNSITPEEMYAKLQKSYQNINQRLHALQKAQQDSAANMQALDKLVADLKAASDGLSAQGFKTNPFKDKVEKIPEQVAAVKALYAGNQPLAGAQQGKALIDNIGVLLIDIKTLVQARSEVRQKELPALTQKVENFVRVLMEETHDVAKLAQEFAAVNFQEQSAQLARNWSIAEQVLGTNGVKPVLAQLDKLKIAAPIKLGSEIKPGVLEVVNSSCSRDDWHQARQQIAAGFALLKGVMEATSSFARQQQLRELKSKVEGDITACGAKLKALDNKLAVLKHGENRSNYHHTSPESVHTELAQAKLKLKEVSPPEQNQSLSPQLKRQLLDAYVTGLNWTAAEKTCLEVSKTCDELDNQINAAHAHYQQATSEIKTLGSMVNKARQLSGNSMSRQEVLVRARTQHERLNGLLKTRGQNWQQLEADAKTAIQSLVELDQYLVKYDQYEAKIVEARRKGASRERIQEMEAAQASGNWGALETIIAAALTAAVVSEVVNSSHDHSGSHGGKRRRQDDGDSLTRTPDAPEDNSGNIGSSGGFRGPTAAAPVEEADPFAGTPDAVEDNSDNIGSSGGFRGPTAEVADSGDGDAFAGTGDADEPADNADAGSSDDAFGDTDDSDE